MKSGFRHGKNSDVMKNESVWAVDLERQASIEQGICAMIFAMKSFENIITIAALVVGARAGIVYALYVGGVAGLGRPRDPERLRRFI